MATKVATPIGVQLNWERLIPARRPPLLDAVLPVLLPLLDLLRALEPAPRLDFGAAVP